MGLESFFTRHVLLSSRTILTLGFLKGQGSIHVSHVWVSALKIIFNGGSQISLQKCLRRTTIWFEEGGLKLFLLNILDKTEETSVVHVRNQRWIMDMTGGHPYYLLDSHSPSPWAQRPSPELQTCS